VVTAARPWLNRLATLLLLIWIVLVVSGAAAIVYLQFACIAISPEKLIGWHHLPRSITDTPGYTGPHFKDVIRPMNRKRKKFVAGVIAGSLGLGFVGAVFATVVLYHWPRQYYFILVLAVPVLMGIFAYCIWKIGTPNVIYSLLPLISANTIAQMLGGASGVILGRPLARLIIRVLLPPRLRPYLAFLWLVDGRQVPQVETSNA
jgi:hypothetical protein